MSDFKKYYDTIRKINIWVLGYFGGGAINVEEASFYAIEYLNRNNVPMNSIFIDEILSSSRFKGFKFIFSNVQQEQEQDSEAMENVYQWLRD